MGVGDDDQNRDERGRERKSENRESGGARGCSLGCDRVWIWKFGGDEQGEMKSREAGYGQGEECRSWREVGTSGNLCGNVGREIRIGQMVDRVGGGAGGRGEEKGNAGTLDQDRERFGISGEGEYGKEG